MKKEVIKGLSNIAEEVVKGVAGKTLAGNRASGDRAGNGADSITDTITGALGGKGGGGGRCGGGGRGGRGGGKGGGGGKGDGGGAGGCGGRSCGR